MKHQEHIFFMVHSKNASWKTSRLNGSTGTWLPAMLAKNSTPILRSTGNPNPMESWCFAIEKGLSTSGMIQPQRPRCHSSWTGKFHTNTTCIQQKKHEQVLRTCPPAFVNSLLILCFSEPTSVIQRVAFQAFHLMSATHICFNSRISPVGELQKTATSDISAILVCLRNKSPSLLLVTVFICYCYHVWPLEEPHGWTQIHLIPYPSYCDLTSILRQGLAPPCDGVGVAAIKASATKIARDSHKISGATPRADRYESLKTNGSKGGNIHPEAGLTMLKSSVHGEIIDFGHFWGSHWHQYLPGKVMFGTYVIHMLKPDFHIRHMFHQNGSDHKFISPKIIC